MNCSPAVGFIVTNRSLPNERVLAFHNQRGAAGRHMKEGKYTLKWTRLSCRRFVTNVVRLQRRALACNLANTLRANRLLTEIEFCAWMSQIVPGDRLEYHRGFLVLDIFPVFSGLDVRRAVYKRQASREKAIHHITHPTKISRTRQDAGREKSGVKA